MNYRDKLSEEEKLEHEIEIFKPTIYNIYEFESKNIKAIGNWKSSHILIEMFS